MEERKHNSHNAFVAHFNIDSTQNKFEELKLLNDSLKAQILILSENKIDRSYPGRPVQTTRIQYVYQRQMQRGWWGHCLFSYIHSFEENEITKDL